MFFCFSRSSLHIIHPLYPFVNNFFRFFSTFYSFVKPVFLTTISCGFHGTCIQDLGQNSRMPIRNPVTAFMCCRYAQTVQKSSKRKPAEGAHPQTCSFRFPVSEILSDQHQSRSVQVHNCPDPHPRQAIFPHQIQLILPASHILKPNHMTHPFVIRILEPG